MNICLVGYGKMGKAIKNVCDDRKINVPVIVDPYDSGANCKKITDIDAKKIDCVIDFSHPTVIMENLNYYIENDIKAVIGTTGWYDKISSLKLKKTTKILYSGNFSIGVAIFLKIVKNASKLFNKLKDYDISITEFHHNAKADSPSGTAFMVAQNVLSEVERKDTILNGNSEGRINPNQLQLSSIRLGSIVGQHNLYFDSLEDTITLTHNAKNRNGFAKGSVDCAEWLISCDKNGLLTLDDYMESVFKD